MCTRPRSSACAGGRRREGLLVTWHRVSAKHPCRICGKPDWCTCTDDGSACCMRVASSRPLRNGGWLHAGDAGAARTVPPPPPARPPRIDATAIWNAYRANTRPDQVDALAAALGVSVGALDALGAAWAPHCQAWAFPMRVAGAVVGIRLRAMDGRKWAVTGSRQGLFIPAIEYAEARLFICEGPTDTAAALSIGLDAIGRPSCRGLELETAAAIRRLGYREVVIVANNDEGKPRPDGALFYPGQDGAAALAQCMPVPHRVWLPPAKDLRDLVRSGCTSGEATSMINACRLQGARHGR